MNEYDSEVMAGLCEALGYFAAEKQEEANLILVNTCCVREKAENKVYGLLGRFRKLKQANPGLIIGVGGCMPQQKNLAREIKSRFPYVNFIFGPHTLFQLPQLIRRAYENKETIIAIQENPVEITEDKPVKRVHNVCAWTPITFGCNNFCTYCIVPYVRGRERSRQPEAILREIKQLVASGYKEITLLGQNVNSYGKDLPDKIDFAALLSRVCQIEELIRLRFLTSHPRDFHQRLIEEIARQPKVCEHIHLPVQAGNNKILKKMNRGYTREEYLALIKNLRQAIPQVAITTDLIVGFPGETNEDFLQTLDLVENVRFASAFTFVYSNRSGTPAAKMPDQVPAEIKKERIQTLIKIQNEITVAENQAEIGKTYQVLVEGRNEKNPSLLAGRTKTNKLVLFPARKDLTGELIQVKITATTLTHLAGVAQVTLV
ncbi:MAG TPA: tRNA (N6-isopentenyl adenosine(37)-C2)-methylthiotransferase MiaB [Desulfotomaculum sp.]|jgi:tRNA-2-methylthio-N6-dimethylallyladenosine synthase|nr:tRNA (N6-isopentenyl adenosine(37)-C2)-methylthiotransferase MiaB [Desulfotomaculum sp.]HCJ78877.1 tRNA (N6-isopentenyl adenosine(37)-C2)-methylthiotransferase MiaB [Desulfotomaculum sp.]